MADYLKELKSIRRYIIEPTDGIMKYQLREWKTGTVMLYSNVEELIRSSMSARQHITEWYGVRFKRLREWVLSLGLPEQKVTEYFSIVANGTKDANTPPTYEQQVSMLKWELEKAQDRIEELEGSNAPV